MIDALTCGKLTAPPEQRTTKAGKPYATAKVSAADREGGDHLVLCVAFDTDAVNALLALQSGDSVALSGELSLSAYTPEGKEPRASLRLLVHRVLTAYAVRRTRESFL